MWGCQIFLLVYYRNRILFREEKKFNQLVMDFHIYLQLPILRIFISHWYTQDLKILTTEDVIVMSHWRQQIFLGNVSILTKRVTGYGYSIEALIKLLGNGNSESPKKKIRKPISIDLIVKAGGHPFIVCDYAVLCYDSWQLK